MDPNLDQMNVWDAQSCAEFEEFLDLMHYEETEDERNDLLNSELEEEAYNELHVSRKGCVLMSSVVNVNSPTANMYGCEPCPKCGSKFRYVPGEAILHIRCDDCGLHEAITSWEDNDDLIPPTVNNEVI